MTQAILVTGGAGFIGSNFVPYICRKYPQYYVVNLDKLTYAGNLDNVRECIGLPNYEFIQGDICDADLLTELFYRYDLRGVIHFAAESHVDNSITGPKVFVSTNVEGTFNLLAAAYEHWMNGPHQVKPGYERCRFHQVSTAAVFGKGAGGKVTEHAPLAPPSPDAASQASADLLVNSYHHSYGLNTTVSLGSPTYGPKLSAHNPVAHLIRQALRLQPLVLAESAEQVTDWLYVGDQCQALDLIFHHGRPGSSYNISPEHPISARALTCCVCDLLDRIYPAAQLHRYQDLIVSAAPRAQVATPAELPVRLCPLDGSKLTRELGWQAHTSLLSGLKVVFLAACCAAVSILFCLMLQLMHMLMARFFKNLYLRVVAGGFLIILLTLLVRSQIRPFFPRSDIYFEHRLPVHLPPGCREIHLRARINRRGRLYHIILLFTPDSGDIAIVLNAYQQSASVCICKSAKRPGYLPAIAHFNLQVKLLMLSLLNKQL